MNPIVIKVCREMIIARGYTNIDDSLYESVRTISASKDDETSDDETSDDETKDDGDIVILFSEELKIGLDYIKNCIITIFANYTHCIIVYPGVVTSFAKNHTAFVKDIEIELFHTRELMLNITQHILVPMKHRLLDMKERKNIQKKYSIKDSQFPRLYKDKPISKFFNFKEGDLIEITRRDGTITYRIVVHGGAKI